MVPEESFAGTYLFFNPPGINSSSIYNIILVTFDMQQKIACKPEYK